MAIVLVLALLITLFSPSPQAFAATLQILHTNDLHSLMDHAEYSDRGGYAAMKSTMMRIRAEAKEKGWETLTLDAGDFSEGSSFYLAQDGLSAYRMMNTFGFDASVIGNHDWLMGPGHLSSILPAVGFNFQLLGANFLQNETRESPLSFIKDYIKPYVIIRRAGVRIAILGLTTNEFFYSWRARGETESKAKIENPITVAKRWLPILRQQADVIIALTHLGVKRDIELIEETSGIDLVVGGHSHHCLYAPVYAKPKGEKRLVPIVQTGHHGENLGSLILDVAPGKKPVLQDYRLLPVVRTAGEDPEVLAAVDRVRAEVIDKYGPAFFLETIAKAQTPLLPPGKAPTIWGNHFAQALMRATNADLSLDIPPFHGRAVYHENVTMEDLFNLYPRVFDFMDAHGWNIWTSRVQGWVLELTFRIMPHFGLAAVVGGVELGDDILIQGKKLERFKYYKVSFGEGVVRASVALHPWLRKILTDPQNTKIPIWLALRDYLKKDLGGVISAAPNRLAPLTYFYNAEESSLNLAPKTEDTCAVWHN